MFGQLLPPLLLLLSVGPRVSILQHDLGTMGMMPLLSRGLSSDVGNSAKHSGYVHVKDKVHCEACLEDKVCCLSAS
jgi:hypothetical protein